jgi:hypothetical protein
LRPHILCSPFSATRTVSGLQCLRRYALANSKKKIDEATIMKIGKCSQFLRIPLALGVLTCSFLSLAARSDKPSAVNFLPAVLYSTNGYEPIAIAVADVNGDGKPDVITTNECSDHTCTNKSVVSVMLGNGNGTFQTPVAYGSAGLYPNFVATGDVNADGKLDLLVTNYCSDSTCTTSSVAVLLGNGDGTFQAPVAYLTGGLNPFSVSLGDMNGDGKPDLVISNSRPGAIAVLLGNGDGTFQTATVYPSGGDGAGITALADVNGDGKLDVLVPVVDPTTGEIGEVGVMIGNGDGTLQTSVIYLSGGDSPGGLAVADVNGDGKLDLVVSNTCRLNNGACTGETVVGVLLGNGDGTFQTAKIYGSGGALAPGSIAVKDMNGDGKLDIVVANECTDGRPINCDIGQVGVLLGNGDGTFQTALTYPAGDAGTVSLAVADVNHDGKLDIIAGNNCNPVTNTNCLTDIGVLLATGAGVQLTPGSINFGSHAVGTTSATRVATLTNASSATLTITDISTAGTNPGDFAVASSTCGSSLAAGSTCTISVTFKPTATGARSGLLQVKDNGAGSPQKVRLSGTGT